MGHGSCIAKIGGAWLGGDKVEDENGEEKIEN
jgi:hypothetical protein